MYRMVSAYQSQHVCSYLHVACCVEAAPSDLKRVRDTGEWRETNSWQSLRATSFKLQLRTKTTEIKTMTIHSPAHGIGKQWIPSIGILPLPEVASNKDTLLQAGNGAGAEPGDILGVAIQYRGTPFDSDDSFPQSNDRSGTSSLLLRLCVVVVNEVRLHLIAGLTFSVGGDKSLDEHITMASECKRLIITIFYTHSDLRILFTIKYTGHTSAHLENNVMSMMR